jgi:aminopeptidase N
MNIHHLAQGGEFTLPNADTHFAPSLSIEPHHLTLHLRVDIEKKHLAAKLSYDVHIHRHDETLTLNAVDLDIHSVTCAGHEIIWEYDGEHIDIRWNNASDNTDARIDIEYTVQSPICGANFGSNYMGTDHETSRARYWLPCIDHSASRTSIDLFVTHHSEHTCLGPGTHIHSNLKEEGWSETHWKFEGLCPVYLFCILVGDLNKWDGGEWNGKPIAAFAPKPISVEDIERAFSPTAALLDFMTEKLGPLPWSKYYQFAMPDIGGAMENISLVSWDSFWVFDEQMHSEWGELLDQINLHELAHTWFGDLIVCRDYAHVWLKESWATYMEAVWFEGTSSTERFEYELLNKRERYFSEVRTRYSRPIMTRTFDTPWQMYDLHLYPGGAVRLHMLRKKMGDDRFWNAVREYIQTYAYKTVETDDFRKMMEKHAHQSLAEFFEQWFFRAGHPFLSVTHKYDSKTKTLVLSAKQSIKGAAKGEEKNYFVFPLEISVQDAQSQWHTHSLEITGENQHITLTLPKSPRQIVIDPHAQSVMDFSFKPGVSMLEKTLVDCPHVNARIHAYRTLINDGKRISLTKVKAALENEPFFAVRTEVAKSLAKSKHPMAKQILSARLHTEKEPRVLADIASACGSHWDKEIAQSLSSFLSQSNIPYRAHANALVALAKQKDFCVEEHIYRAVDDQGWWGFIRKNAAMALGHRKTKKAADKLMSMAKDTSERSHVRADAFIGLAQCAKYFTDQDKAEILAIIHNAVQDPIYRVRLNAARALGVLGDASSISVINQSKSLFAGQDEPVLNRIIQKIRDHQKSDPTKELQGRIDKLEKTIATLQDNIEKLQSRDTDD